jgi:hypothetical protein
VRYFSIVLLLSVTCGCGMKLQELRSLTSENKTTTKDAFCVYSKMNGKAITTQTKSYLIARFIWNSNWDPSRKSGEIFAMMDDQYKNYHMIFNIGEYGNITKIEMRVPNSSYDWIKDYARSIYDTDLSECNEANNMATVP